MQLSRFGMRIVTTFFVATLALGIAAVGSVGAAAPTGSPDAVVKKFIDDFNKGDTGPGHCEGTPCEPDHGPGDPTEPGDGSGGGDGSGTGSGDDGSLY